MSRPPLRATAARPQRSVIGSLIAAGLAGRLIRRFGTLRTNAYGSVALAAALAVAASSGDVWWFAAALLVAGAVDAVVGETNADVAVIGTCSAQPGFGLTSTSYDDAQVKRACLASGARWILVTTADKLTRTSTFRFGEPADLTHLVTTADAERETLAPFRAEGVEVHLVEAPPPVT